MTLDEARANVGAGVVYQPHRNATAEDGEIVGFSETMVFVRYSGGWTPKATRAEDLRFLAPTRQARP